MPNFAFDGKTLKAIAPQAGWNDAYYASTFEATMGTNLAVVNGVSALSSYQLVPWLYRAVTKKAMLVSRMPFDLMKGEQDVKDDPAYASLMTGFRNNLYALTISKIVTGAGYWYIDANAAGRNLTLRFLRPMFVQPVSGKSGLTGFRFSDTTTDTIPREIPLDRIVYSWMLNLHSEVKPGPGEAAVVLGASSMLYALDAFTAAFFNGGGVPAQIFSVPQQMSETDKANFQTFIQRVMNGVRNAFRTVVVRNNISVTQVGAHIKDTLAPELSQQQRESVAAGLGFPPAAISGDHQNKATADIIALTTMTDSIIPFTEALYDDINRQLFKRFGVELVARPERLEVMQDAQLAQAQAIMAVVGQPVLTVDEGRELMGREPLPKDEAEEPAPPPAEAEAQAEELEDGEEVEPEAPEPEPPAKSVVIWRDAVLAAVRAGQSTNVPVPIDLPLAYVRRVDHALRSARSASAVRRVFERHWPRPHLTPETPPPAPDLELAEAVKALQAYNALAQVQPPPAPPNITVNLPAQSFTLPAAAAPPIVVNMPEQAPPVVNVAAAEAPVVNVAAPVVNVAAPNVSVEMPGRQAARVVRDQFGRVERLETTE